MKPMEWQAKVQTLEKTVEDLEARVTVAEDIESIKKLQRAYGYYLEPWQEEEIVESFCTY